MTQELVGTGLVAGTWTIDPSHSTVGFTVRHLMSKVRGTFTDFSGTIVTTEDPAASTVEVAITSASITTNNEQRDGHLRSTDFFDAEAGQQLVFVSTGVTEGAGRPRHRRRPDHQRRAPAPSSWPREFLGVAVDAYGVTRLGAEATTSISRKEFGVDFNVPLEGGKLLIGDKIDISLEIEAVLS